MSTISPALSMVRSSIREEVVDSVDRFSPEQPLIWIHFQKRRALEKGMPLLTRLRAFLHDSYLYLRYDFLRQPVVSEERKLVVPLFRTGYLTRQAARAKCRTARDVLYALPAELPLDAEVGFNPTQVCPLLEPQKDAEQKRLYAGADLRMFICAELAEENAYLRAENARVSTELAIINATLNLDEDVL